MGRIDLGRESAIKVPSMPAGHQSVVGGYSQVASGMSAINRASEHLANGVAHVGKMLAGISHDMAETKNAVDFSDYQLQSFKIQKEEVVDKMEADMLAGKINNRDTFEAKLKEYTKLASDKKNEFAKKSGYAPAVLDKISIHEKNDQLKSYAELSGMYVRYENKKMIDTVENNCAEFSLTTDKNAPENIKRTIAPLRAKFSKEYCDALEKKYTDAYYGNQINVFKAEFENCCSAEEMEKLVKEFKGSDEYKNLNDVNKKLFSIGIDGKIKAQREAEKANEDIGNKIVGLKSGIELVLSSPNLNILEVNWGEWDKKFESILGESGFDNNKITEAKADWAEWKSQTQNKAQERLNNAMCSRVKNLYVSSQNGDISLSELFKRSKLSDKEEEIELFGSANKGYNSYADFVYAKRKEFNQAVVSNWKNYDKKEKAKYSLLTKGAFSSILEYDKASDPQGKKAENILRVIQFFDDETRDAMQKAMFSKFVKNNDFPNEWSNADRDEFDKKISSLSAWDDDEENMANVSLHYKLRDRMLGLARIRKMSLSEAMNELENDPFVKQLYVTKNREIVRKFLGIKYGK